MLFLYIKVSLFTPTPGVARPVLLLYIHKRISLYSERMNIQMENGQTTHKNRALSHDQQQTAQETSPLSAGTFPGRQWLEVDLQEV